MLNSDSAVIALTLNQGDQAATIDSEAPLGRSGDVQWSVILHTCIFVSEEPFGNLELNPWWPASGGNETTNNVLDRGNKITVMWPEFKKDKRAVSADAFMFFLPVIRRKMK